MLGTVWSSLVAAMQKREGRTHRQCQKGKKIVVNRSYAAEIPGNRKLASSLGVMSSFDWSVFLFSLGQIRQPIELFDCRYCQIFAMLENETSIPIPGHLFFTSLKINLLDRLTFETNNDNLICSASQYQKHVKNIYECR